MKSSSKQAVDQFLKEHPEYAHRKFQYHIVGLIAGITPEQAEMAMTISRRIRDLIPNDAKGEQLAKEWCIENGKDHIFDHIPEKVFLINGVPMKVTN